MGKTTVAEPEILVETPRIDDQCVSFPFSHRTTVIERVIIVAAHLAGMSASVSIDDPEIVVTTADQHENPLPRAIFHELNAVGELELARSAGRLAIQKHRIVLQETALALEVERTRPRLQRCHF